MKILALIVLVCVFSLALSQTREQPRRQPEQPTQPGQAGDVMMNKRLLVQGKLGRSIDDLQHDFNGLITNLKVGDLVLSHVAARVVPKGEKQLTEKEMKEQLEESDEDEGFGKGVLLNAWIFLDKNSDRSKTFFHVRRSAEDIGICYRVDSDNSRLKDWVKSNERCGANNRGILYTLNYDAAEQAAFPIDMQYTLCLEGDKIKTITGRGLQRDQVLAAINAQVVDRAESPDETDATTFLDEFSLPFHCAVAARKFDVNAINSIVETLKNLEKSDEREIIGSRDEQIRGSRETRLPIVEERREKLKPVVERERVTLKPIEEEKLDKPVMN